jgi:hypothetical protein
MKTILVGIFTLGAGLVAPAGCRTVPGPAERPTKAIAETPAPTSMTGTKSVLEDQLALVARLAGSNAFDDRVALVRLVAESPDDAVRKAAMIAIVAEAPLEATREHLLARLPHVRIQNVTLKEAIGERILREAHLSCELSWGSEDMNMLVSYEADDVPALEAVAKLLVKANVKAAIRFNDEGRTWVTTVER